jgi:hypothetical protein
MLVRNGLTMDERQTLSMLAWTIASLITAIFILNAIALS